MKNMDGIPELSVSLIQHAIDGNEKALETILKIYDRYIDIWLHMK